jgi:hypothetical protein
MSASSVKYPRLSENYYTTVFYIRSEHPSACPRYLKTSPDRICPRCGARTEIEREFSFLPSTVMLQHCLGCKFRFVDMDDPQFK